MKTRCNRTAKQNKDKEQQSKIAEGPQQQTGIPKQQYHAWSYNNTKNNSNYNTTKPNNSHKNEHWTHQWWQTPHQKKQKHHPQEHQTKTRSKQSQSHHQPGCRVKCSSGCSRLAFQIKLAKAIQEVAERPEATGKHHSAGAHSQDGFVQFAMVGPTTHAIILITNRETSSFGGVHVFWTNSCGEVGSPGKTA